MVSSAGTEMETDNEVVFTPKQTAWWTLENIWQQNHCNNAVDAGFSHELRSKIAEQARKPLMAILVASANSPCT